MSLKHSPAGLATDNTERCKRFSDKYDRCDTVSSEPKVDDSAELDVHLSI